MYSNAAKKHYRLYIYKRNDELKGKLGRKFFLPIANVVFMIIQHTVTCNTFVKKYVRHNMLSQK